MSRGDGTDPPRRLPPRQGESDCPRGSGIAPHRRRFTLRSIPSAPLSIVFRHGLFLTLAFLTLQGAVPPFPGWDAGPGPSVSRPVPEGNYRVTVTVGDPDRSANTTIRAELRRLMAGPVQTARGQRVVLRFVVNVRAPTLPGGGLVRLKPREKTREILDWDDRLTLEWDGPSAAVTAVAVEAAPALPTVYLAGDSTVCDQPDEPFASWGQMITRFFGPGVAIANHAESGESLRSFIAEGRLAKLDSLMRPGDYLFIEFGHNDQKERGPGVGAFTSYRRDLERFVADARAHGATPVLLTPVSRRTFGPGGRIRNSLGDFPAAVRQAARETQAPLIDLNAASVLLYEAFGPERAALLFPLIRESGKAPTTTILAPTKSPAAWSREFGGPACPWCARSGGTRAISIRGTRTIPPLSICRPARGSTRPSPMAARTWTVLAALACSGPVLRPAPPGLDLPAWTGAVGAHRRPPEGPVVSANACGARGDGRADCRAAIQQAIDACAARGGGTVALLPGRYLTGALFLKTGVRLRIDPGVTLVATTDESAYPLLPTRVAGIEMVWPAALINVDGQSDVEVSGGGAIDGRGPYWWKKYWDLRRRYTERGLRWAADYDCRRVRLIVVWKSRDVTVAGARLVRAGFWTVQIAYSEGVTVDGVTIAENFAAEGVRGASTDGIDVDSSSRVLVQGCDIDNNDDDICLKAGRDADGLRVGRPTEFVLIRDNLCRRGGGVVSFGSETSGGIRHIVAERNRGIGTSEGIRFKSTRTRGGEIADILIRGLTLRGVARPFTFTLDWDPSFNAARIPAGYRSPPAYWRILTAPVLPPERGYTDLRDITIASVRAVGAGEILFASGLAEQPIGAVRWEDVQVDGREAGEVRAARDWTMQSVCFRTGDGRPLSLRDCSRVASPVVIRN